MSLSEVFQICLAKRMRALCAKKKGRWFKTAVIAC